MCCKNVSAVSIQGVSWLNALELETGGRLPVFVLAGVSWTCAGTSDDFAVECQKSCIITYHEIWWKDFLFYNKTMLQASCCKLQATPLKHFAVSLHDENLCTLSWAQQLCSPPVQTSNVDFEQLLTFKNSRSLQHRQRYENTRLCRTNVMYLMSVW